MIDIKWNERCIHRSAYRPLNMFLISFIVVYLVWQLVLYGCIYSSTECIHVFYTWFHFIKFLSIIRIDWLNGSDMCVRVCVCVLYHWHLRACLGTYHLFGSRFAHTGTGFCLVDWSVLTHFYHRYIITNGNSWKILSNIEDGTKKAIQWNRITTRVGREQKKNTHTSSCQSAKKMVKHENLVVAMRSNVSIKINIMALI